MRGGEIITTCYEAYMLALLFTLCIFLWWFFIGRSALLLITPNKDPIFRDLLAPAVGMAMTVIAVFSLSRAGFTVSTIARPLCIMGLCFAAFIQTKIQRTPFALPLHSLALLLFASLTIAWPFLHYTFDWLSYGNNDMTNYSLLAQHYLHHSYFEVPTLTELFSGKNYSQTFWLQGLLERSGSELTLAWVAGTSQLPTIKCFMPVIISYHLALICAGGSLVYAATLNTRTVWLSCLCLSVSPLLAFGTLYQLMGQTSGLTLLTANLSVTALLFKEKIKTQIFREAFILSLLLCALLIYYPEVLPFYLLSAGTYLMVLNANTFFKTKYINWNTAYALIPLCIILPIILQSYLYCVHSFLSQQVVRGVTGSKHAVDFFQQSLRPSGLAGIWGIFNI